MRRHKMKLLNSTQLLNTERDTFTIDVIVSVNNTKYINKTSAVSTCSAAHCSNSSEKHWIKQSDMVTGRSPILGIRMCIWKYKSQHSQHYASTLRIIELKGKKGKGNPSQGMGTPSQSSGMSLAIWDHTSVTCHPTQVNKPRLTPAMQGGTQFTYLGGMEGWVDVTVSKQSFTFYDPLDT